MSTSKRLGVFAFRMASGGSFGTNATEWLFGDSEFSALSFMRTCAGLALSVSADIHAEIDLSDDEARLIRSDAERSTRLANLANIARNRGHAFDDYDALVFGTYGEPTDTGASFVLDKVKRETDPLFPVNVFDHVGEAVRVIPTMIFDDIAPHNMICHELGHIVGMRHAYWDIPGAQYPFGEYNSPYDAMGYSGVTAATFTIPVDGRSTIDAAAVLWQAGGPAFAQASVWRCLPDFPAAAPWVAVVESADTKTIHLQAANEGGGNRPTLAATKDAQGAWWTVEYRPRRNWDRGLTDLPRNGSVRAGLVIHKIGEVGNASVTGFPRAQEVQYVAVVPVRSVGDSDWENESIRVTLREHLHTGVLVELGPSIAKAPRVYFKVEDAGHGNERRTRGGAEYVPLTGRNCQGGEVALDLVSRSHAFEAEAQSLGFDAPVFQFLINGRALGPISKGDTATSGTVVIPKVAVEVPTGRFSSITEVRSVSVDFTREWNRLSFRFGAGDGQYTVRLGVKALEESDLAITAFFETVLSVTTATLELSGEAQGEFNRCLRRRVEFALERQIFERRGPTDAPGWGRPDRGWLIDALAQITTAARHSPVVADRARRRVLREAGLGGSEAAFWAKTVLDVIRRR